MSLIEKLLISAVAESESFKHLIVSTIGRWTSARRGGMTVLGKVAVPKPINLPSQRYLLHRSIIIIVIWHLRVSSMLLDLNISLLCSMLLSFWNYVFCLLLQVRKPWLGPKCGNCTQVSMQLFIWVISLFLALSHIINKF